MDGDAGRPGLGRFVGGEEPAAPSGPALDVLRRIMDPSRRTRPGEACEMCGEPIPDEHSHVVNLESRGLLCTCRACFLLFTHEGAAQGKYRAVPDRYLYDPSFELTEAQWEDAQIPVNMAFFFQNSALERWAAFYPSPGGATESLLDLDTWQQVMRANPLFESVAPDVEALLVYRTDGRFECFLVPIDACYELVGLVRMHWKGFHGGEDVWREIEAYFDALRERSRTVERPSAAADAVGSEPRP